MLRFLLDEHLSPHIADVLRSIDSEIEIATLSTGTTAAWQGLDDLSLLRAASEAQLALVTFDLRTIPAILQGMNARGGRHSGIVFISPKTFKPNEFAAIAEALASLWTELKNEDWGNRIQFLRRASP